MKYKNQELRNAAPKPASAHLFQKAAPKEASTSHCSELTKNHAVDAADVMFFCRRLKDIIDCVLIEKRAKGASPALALLVLEGLIC